MIFNNSMIPSHLSHERLFMPKTFSGFQKEKMIVIRERCMPDVDVCSAEHAAFSACVIGLAQHVRQGFIWLICQSSDRKECCCPAHCSLMK